MRHAPMPSDATLQTVVLLAAAGSGTRCNACPYCCRRKCCWLHLRQACKPWAQLRCLPRQLLYWPFAGATGAAACGAAAAPGLGAAAAAAAFSAARSALNSAAARGGAFVGQGTRGQRRAETWAGLRHGRGRGREHCEQRAARARAALLLKRRRPPTWELTPLHHRINFPLVALCSALASVHVDVIAGEARAKGLGALRGHQGCCCGGGARKQQAAGHRRRGGARRRRGRLSSAGHTTARCSCGHPGGRWRLAQSCGAGCGPHCRCLGAGVCKLEVGTEGETDRGRGARWRTFI